MADRGAAGDTTIRPTGPPATRAAPPAVFLTVLWHPDPARAGDLAPLPARLSRLEPELADPAGTGRAPLGDPHLSRTPIDFTALPRGGVRVEAPALAELIVDGVPLRGARELAGDAIARGVVLELAGHVALLLHLRRAPTADADRHGFIGASEAAEALRREIDRVAPLAVPVLLGGETGSGKERVARALHARSPRAEGPFVAVNMATLAPAMAAAQLFGHTRGAFTGADRAHPGLFEQAHGGTLFLDEIADAPPEVQAMLLRVLETGEVQPIGADAARRLDVRVIAASDADLTAEVELRPQLYHRLAGYRIAVPPLRDRVDDLGRLLASFVVRELGAPPPIAKGTPWLPAAALRAYVQHPWPGNVRELANLARHLAVQGRTETLTLAAAVAPIGVGGGGGGVAVGGPELGTRVSDERLISTLAAQRWRTGAAAAALGISKTTLYALIERCPTIRKARDLGADEIAACGAEHGGDLEAMSERLRVSKRGLQLRIRELGM